MRFVLGYLVLPLAILILPTNSSALPGWAREALKSERRAPAGDDAGTVAPVTYVLADIFVEARGTRRVEVTRREVLRVNLPEGVGEAVASYPAWEKRRVERIKGWHRRPDGREEELDDERVIEFAAPGPAAIYSDARVVAAVFGDVQVGSVVVWEAKIDDRDTAALTQHLLLPLHCAVDRFRLEAVAPREWRIRHATRYLGQPIDRAVEGTLELFSEALPPVPPLVLAPHHAPESRQVLLAFSAPGEKEPSFDSWQEVAAWEDEVFAAAAVADSQVVDEVRRLCAGQEGRQEQVAAVASFVQRDIRYVSLALGEGRWEPRAAGRTLFNRFADCKDKTVLLQTMFREIGVETVPVLVHTEDRIEQDVPTPFQFNHVVVGVRLDDLGEEYRDRHAAVGPWLLFDPTDRTTEFGDLPVHLANTSVLIAARDGGLLETGDADPRSRLRLVGEQLRVEASGEFRGKIRVRDHGALGNQTREVVRFRGEEGLRSWVGALLGPGSRVVSVRLSEDRPSDGFIETTIEVEGRLWHSSDGGFFVSPSAVRFPSVSCVSGAHRREAIRLGPPAELVVQSVWHVPASLSAGRVAQADTLRCGSTRLAYEVRADGSVIRTRWSYREAGGTLPVASIPSAREFAAELGALENLAIAVTRAE